MLGGGIPRGRSITAVRATTATAAMFARCSLFNFIPLSLLLAPRSGAKIFFLIFYLHKTNGLFTILI